MISACCRSKACISFVFRSRLALTSCFSRRSSSLSRWSGVWMSVLRRWYSSNFSLSSMPCSYHFFLSSASAWILSSAASTVFLRKSGSFAVRSGSSPQLPQFFVLCFSGLSSQSGLLSQSGFLSQSGLLLEGGLLLLPHRWAIEEVRTQCLLQDFKRYASCRTYKQKLTSPTSLQKLQRVASPIKFCDSQVDL